MNYLTPRGQFTRRYKILAVDDDPLILSVFEAACRPFELQAKVHTANSVHGAIDICRQEDFDMLCLDHNIEGITGWELLDYLRPHLRNAKVIIYSAGVDESSQQEYARRRVIGILKKPLSPAALGFSIRKALGI